jgi:hypothetical protein
MATKESCTDYALAWTSLDGKALSPIPVETSAVHTIARRMVDDDGGIVRVLRAVAGSWREVARYTAGSARPTPG